MRAVDNETRQTMNSRRNFVNYATMHLSDGRVLNLTPSDFRVSGNNFTDDLIDGEAFQIGTAIGKTATILLDNTDGRVEDFYTLQTSQPADWSSNFNDYYIKDGNRYIPVPGSSVPTWTADTYYTKSSVTYPHGKFSEYDFYMSYFELYVCLPDAYHYGGELKNQMIPIGTFTVITPTSHGSTVEITGVDNMYMFDKSFDNCSLDFSLKPSLITILNRCCTDCGVGIGYSGFDNKDLTVGEKPENVTYRQVVSYIATIAGCNAKINTTGSLILTSYDMSALNGLDGGSFTEIGTEYQYRQGTWDGVAQSYTNIGYNAHYASNVINRTGTYKITKVVIDNIVDPTNFNATYQINEYDAFDANIPNALTRYNSRIVKTGTLSAGDNVIDYDIAITSNSNSTVYWLGVSQDNTNPNASKFRYTYFLEPISYDDGDSADGGSFEPERYIYRDWNGVNGTTIGDIQYRLQTFMCPDYIGLPGKYKFTRIRIYNIVYPTHFNPVYLVQKSVDGGTTWTDEDNGPIVSGYNTINYQFELPNNNSTRFRIMVGQDIVADPSATKFDIDFCFKADDTYYIDGDTLDGGDFTTPLGFHNLSSVTGTSVGTDDIQITGVSVKYDDTSVHYPTSIGWDYYALVIEDNPFVKDHESSIATSIYNKLKNLIFRPFITSSIQDPTIEAGDCCVVYDVKGNMYKSIITNVVFTTGGYTEVSCNAEPPARQGSRYSAPASVVKVANEMTSYQSQTAHFNEIASAALGYFKTEIADGTTGAITTYLHDQPTLASSQNVVKIASGIVAISDNYNTTRTWNTGFDASTGTMLLNLIYVHGLTSDWINTGELTVGGVDNIDGFIHVVNEQLWGNGTWDPSSATIGEGWWSSWTIRCSNFNNIAGTYKLTKVVIDNISDPTKLIDFRLQVSISTDNGSTWTRAYDNELVAGDNILNFVMDITATDDKIYKLWIGKYHTVADDPTFQHHPYTTWINTIIDKDGVEIRKGSIKLNGKNSYTANAYGAYMGSDGISFGLYYSSHSDFEVNASTGEMFARKGKIGCYTINSIDGFLYNPGDYYCEYSYYKLHIGGLWNNSYWTFFGVANKGEFMHLDYGGSSSGGIWITANGANNLWDFSGGAMHITKSSVSCDAHGEVQWSGSDEKLKQNIEDLTVEEAKELIDNVTERKFEFKSEPGKKRYGFIAQEVREILPEDSGIEFEVENICNINYNDFIAPLCMMVKEQQKEIDDLKERIKALEKIVNAKLK